MLGMLAVSSILLVIIMSGRFVKYLTRAASGEMSPDVVFTVLMYRVPSFLEVILPLGLFLGFLLGYGRLYLESEMTVLEACGMSRKRLLGYSMGPALFVAIIVGVLGIYVTPYSGGQANKIADEQESSSEFETLTPGRFHKQKTGSRVTYTDSIEGEGHLGMVFIADQNKSTKRMQITMAEAGTTHFDEELDQRFLVLEKGYRYEGDPGKGDYIELGFERYGTEIEKKNQAIRVDDVETLPTSYLMQSDKPQHQAQLHWRLSLPVLAIVVTMLAVPLSRVNPRQGRYARLAPSIVLYLTYLSILSTVTSDVGKGDVGPWAIWFVHLLFTLFALNLLIFGDFWSRVYNRIPPLKVKRPGKKSV